MYSQYIFPAKIPGFEHIVDIFVFFHVRIMNVHPYFDILMLVSASWNPSGLFWRTQVVHVCNAPYTNE